VGEALGRHRHRHRLLASQGHAIAAACGATIRCSTARATTGSPVQRLAGRSVPVVYDSVGATPSWVRSTACGRWAWRSTTAARRAVEPL
jgi:hypothetical protein